MSAVAVAFPPENKPEPLRPVFDSGDDSRALFSRSLLVSFSIHFGVLITLFSVASAPPAPPEVIATPVDHAFDVSMISLSALDTLLPKGIPSAPLPVTSPLPALPDTPPPPAAAVKKPQRRVEPKRPVAASQPAEGMPKKAPEQKVIPQPPEHAGEGAMGSSSGSSTASATSHSSAHSSAQSYGVPDGEAISFEQARISYQDVVATRLARVKRYPERAIRRRMTGEGAIRLEISSDGSVAGVQIIRSTNTPILDEELRAMVDRAAPFPAFPGDLRKNRLALIVPIAFRLEG